MPLSMTVTGSLVQLARNRPEPLSLRFNHGNIIPTAQNSHSEDV
jgi:hypothetical protein